jgi:N-acetylglucosamine kinase-like BadF-type ATPase
MSTSNLILGIDGGGTSTRAVLAELPSGAVLGEGVAGPGNIKAVGFDRAMEAIAEACQAAFSVAQMTPQTVEFACLALAGAGRTEDHPPIKSWIQTSGMSKFVTIVPDALAVLAAGSQDIVGVSLISGTGSMAFARNHQNKSARAGGWGYLFGDEGSGYAVALAALRSVAQSADGRGPPTELLPCILRELKLDRAEQIPMLLYSEEWDRRRLAGLARTVDECAAFDPTAQRLIEGAARELASAVAAVTKKLNWSEKPTVHGAGGFILGSTHLQTALKNELSKLELEFHLVAKPVMGSINIAQRWARGETW